MCSRCGKAFRFPSDLEAHLRRKTPCGTLIYEPHQLSDEEQQKEHHCKFCGHRFTTRQGLSRHTRKSCKIAGSAEGMQKLYEHTLKRQAEQQAQENADLRADLDDLREQVRQLSKQPTTVVQQNIAHQTNMNITLNFFGGEDVAHISRAEVRRLLDSSLQQSRAPDQAALAALLKAAQLIYSNPLYPENLTCYLPNVKGDAVMVHYSNGWHIEPCPLVIPPMVAKSVGVLFDQQPLEEAGKYGDLLKALRANEEAFKQGKKMKPVLVQSRELLEKALGSLPRAAPPR